MGQDDKHQHQEATDQQLETSHTKDQDKSVGREERTLGEKGGQAQRTSEDRSHQSHYEDDMLDDDG